MVAETKQLESMTFFRSYFIAIESCTLDPADKWELCRAVLTYGLDGTETELEGNAKSFFSLIKPNINTSRSKRISGSKGGEEKAKGKQSDSGEQAKGKQSDSGEQAKGKQDATKQVYYPYNYPSQEGGAGGGRASIVDEVEEIFSSYPPGRNPNRNISHAAICESVKNMVDGKKFPTPQDAAKFIAGRTKRFAECVKGANPRFIPLLQNWISGGGFWADEDDWRMIGRDAFSDSGSDRPLAKTVDEILDEMERSRA